MRWIAVVLLVMSLCPSLASAQDDEALRRAVDADRRGKALFARGEWIDAARAFHEAFEAHPIAPILKSEVVAWSKAERCDEAQALLDEHQGLIATLPQTDVRDLGRIRTDCALMDAEARLVAGDLDGAAAQMDEAEQRDVEGRQTAAIAELRARIEARRTPAADGREEPVAQAPAVDAPQPSLRPVLGWSLIGAGVVAAATVPIFLTPGYRAELEEHEALVATCAGREPCAVDDPTAAQARHASLRRRYVAQYPLLIGGTLLAATGVVVLVTGEERVALGLNPAGVTVTMRW